MPNAVRHRSLIALLVAVGLIAASATPSAAQEPHATEPIDDPETSILQIRANVTSTMTGSAPFDASSGPGLDVSGADAVLRSHDSVTYGLEMQLIGAATDDRVVIEHRLPEGLRWPVASALPGTCRAGSTVSDDGRTLRCVRGDVRPNSVSTVSLVASLVASQRQGTAVPHDPEAIVVTAEDASTGEPVRATATPEPIVVSSAPRINLGVARGAVVPGVTERDGTRGYYLPHSVYLSITGYNSDGGRGARGATGPDGPVTFRIDLSGYTAGSRIASVNAVSAPVPALCLVGAFNTDVFPEARGGGVGAVTDSGTWQCSPSEDGRSIEVTVSGADLTGDHIPTQSGTGKPIATRGYLALGRFGVFVPEVDVPTSGGVPVSLVLDQLSADGSDVDGVLIPNAQDSPEDNSASATIARRSGAGTHISRYVDRRTENGLVPGQSTLGSGDAPVVAGQRFEQATSWTNDNTDDALDDAILCAVFDPKTQHVVGRPDGTPPVQTQSGAGPLIVEYGTRRTVDLDASDAVRQEQLDAVTCDDDDDAWSTAVPETDEVTKVRVRPASGSIPVRGSLTVWVQLAAKQGVELGTPITVTYSVKSSGNGPDRESSSEVVRDGWWHGVYRSQDGNAHYPRGDQLIAADVHLSIMKRAIDPATAPGQPAPITTGGSVAFEIAPVIVSQDDVGTRADHTRVVDLLPAGLVFEADSASPQPTTVETDAGGNTRLVWELGTIHDDHEPVITYRATAGALASGELVNRVLIASPDDPTSPDDFPADVTTKNTHLSRQSVIVTAATGLQIDKTSAQRAVEPGDAVEYLLTFANLSADQMQQDVAVIDVLPYPGDRRGSTAQGRLAGPVDTLAEARYTAASSALVDEFVQADSGDDFGRLPDGHRWCTPHEFGEAGCPSAFGEVTALQMTLAELPPAAHAGGRYTLDTTATTTEDRFANDAVIHSSTQLLGARSHIVETDVVTSAVGERIWWDLDANGLDDDGVEGGRGAGIPQLELRLAGTDKFGAVVDRRATTDDDGHYRFDGLISGTYEIAVTPPASATFTRLREGGDDLRNSAVDPETALMSDIVVEDPSLTLEDGLDLRWNGGLLAADGAPAPGPSGPTDALVQAGFGGGTALLVSLSGLLLGVAVLVARRRLRTRPPGRSGH
ncbi:hypothetical protein KXS11_00420 [Plantibacter flavus]|uniref:SdrD B-like domain-containing protein n=1 Tax=Plantibacter flavus TaxID=150123 RepID=UPI003F13B57D